MNGTAAPRAARCTRAAWTAGAVALAASVLAMVLAARPPEEGLGPRVAFAAAGVAACALHVVLFRGSERIALRLRHVLVVALALRAAAFPLLPSLSDDGYRYVWDGLVATQTDYSPYALAPSDERLLSLREPGRFDRLNSPEYHSVYPPVSQAVFRLGGQAATLWGWAAGWYIIKAVVALAELAGLVALSRLVAPRWLLAYAWHPLPVLAFAGQGHTEGLMLGALGLALLLLSRRRSLGAGVSFALAAGAKLYPAALLPLLAHRLGRRGTLLGLATTAALLLPMAGYAKEIGSSLALYGGVFTFYAGPHALLAWAGWPLFGEAASRGASLLLGGTWAASLVATATVSEGSDRAARHALWVVFAGYVAASSVVHPWYATGMLFSSPLLQKYFYPLFWFASGALISYLSYSLPAAAQPLFMGALTAVGWGGALVLLARELALFQALLRLRARRKWKRIERCGLLLRPHERLLDYGCGEGYVAAAAAEASGAEVVLADVADFNRTARPLLRLGARAPAPLPDRSFDLVLLVFVLHHAERPPAVLADALRLSKSRVVLWESVVRAPLHRRLLEGTDRLVNRLRSARFRDLEPHLAMRSAAHWQDAVEVQGARIVAAHHWGWFHRQALYVVAPPGVDYQGASSRAAAVRHAASNEAGDADGPSSHA